MLTMHDYRVLLGNANIFWYNELCS